MFVAALSLSIYLSLNSESRCRNNLVYNIITSSNRVKGLSEEMYIFFRCNNVSSSAEMLKRYILLYWRSVIVSKRNSASIINATMISFNCCLVCPPTPLNHPLTCSMSEPICPYWSSCDMRAESTGSGPSGPQLVSIVAVLPENNVHMQGVENDIHYLQYEECIAKWPSIALSTTHIYHACCTMNYWLHFTSLLLWNRR